MARFVSRERQQLELVLPRLLTLSARQLKNDKLIRSKICATIGFVSELC